MNHLTVTPLALQLKPLIDFLLRTPSGEQAAQADALNARHTAIEHLVGMKAQYDANPGASTGIVMWCIDLLAALPVPPIPFRSYEELITFRRSDQLVESLITLLVTAVRNPQPLPTNPPSTNAELFINTIYDLAVLRWLMFAVISATPEISLVPLFLYSSERLYEFGNPVFESVRDRRPINMTQAHTSRADEYLRVMGSTVSHDLISDSLCDLFINHYADGIVSEANGVEKALGPKFVTRLQSSRVSLYKLSILETLLKYSQFKTFPSRVDKSVSEFCVSSLEGLLQTHMALLNPALCDIFCGLEQIHFEACGGGKGGETGWFAGGLVTMGMVETARGVCKTESDGLLMRVIDRIQDWFLQREKDSSSSTDLITSFTPQLDHLCSLLSNRCEHEQLLKGSFPTNPNNSTKAINNHLLLLLELCGLGLGKQKAAEIFIHLIQTCARPVLSVPLDPIALSQADIGELNTVYVVGSLRLAWKSRDGVAGAYKLALEGIMKTVPDAKTVLNLWYLVMVNDERVLHTDREQTTKALLASHWKRLLDLTTDPSVTSPTRIVLLQTIQELIPTINTLLAIQPMTSLLAPSLLSIYFSIVTDTISSLLVARQRQKDPTLAAPATTDTISINDQISSLHELSRAIGKSSVGAARFEGTLDLLLSNMMQFQVLAPSTDAAVVALEKELLPLSLAATPPLVVGKSSGSTTPMSVDAEASGEFSFLDRLKVGSGGLGGMAGAEGEEKEEAGGILFIEKKEFEKHNLDVLMELRRKRRRVVDASEWSSDFETFTSYLINCCVDSQDSLQPTLICLAERLHHALGLRPFDSIATALPFLEQSASDKSVVAKFKTYKVLWEAMMLIAQDSTAFAIVKEVIRIHCAHLVTFWSRNSTVPHRRAGKDFSIELESTERLIRLIALVTRLGSQATDCTLLLPFIKSKDVSDLVTLFWDISDTLSANGVIVNGKMVVVPENESAMDTGEVEGKKGVLLDRLKDTVGGIVKRNVVEIGAELAVLFLV
ncbi:hypothetical protein HDU98_005952 [Podochytrium sp. JEL0797]|nr:hypothetical protein HDU98_005952 [Podochytrium sp. JEL0797]